MVDIRALSLRALDQLESRASTSEGGKSPCYTQRPREDISGSIL